MTTKIRQILASNDGDTLIEVIIGVVIIGTVLLSAYTLSSRSFQLGLSSRERVQAAQLMQTQAEGLKALRDSNNWSDFVDLLPPPGSEFHVFANGANQWEISRNRLNNPSLNAKPSIYSDIWVTGSLSGPDPTEPDKFEGTIHVEWPRIGGGTEVSSMPFKLTDRAIPLTNLTLDPPEAPDVDFTGSPTSGVLDNNGEFTVEFTDESSNAPTSWQWDFGDGGTSTEQHPEHTYTSRGIYGVELVACNAGDCGSRKKLAYVVVMSQSDCTAPEFKLNANTFAGDGVMVFDENADQNGARRFSVRDDPDQSASRRFTPPSCIYNSITATGRITGGGTSDGVVDMRVRIDDGTSITEDTLRFDSTNYETLGFIRPFSSTITITIELLGLEPAELFYLDFMEVRQTTSAASGLGPVAASNLEATISVNTTTNEITLTYDN